MTIDARGLGCPKPVLMAEEELKKIQDGVIEILVDNLGSVNNLKRFAEKNGHFAEDTKIENYWKVRIIKGYSCEIEAKNEEASKKKGLFLVIATDTIGKDEALGKLLMKSYFETMKVYGELPDTIFLMNTAVRLTTIDDEMVQILKDFADRGVEIFSCGTCLRYFNLEDKLRVGFRGTTNNLIEGTKEHTKTLWIG